CVRVCVCARTCVCVCMSVCAAYLAAVRANTRTHTQTFHQSVCVCPGEGAEQRGQDAGTGCTATSCNSSNHFLCQTHGVNRNNNPNGSNSKSSPLLSTMLDSMLKLYRPL